MQEFYAFYGAVSGQFRVAVSVGVIILGILIYFVILGFITANPQKDDAQLNIDKMDEQIQKLQERHEILQRRFDEEQMNIQNINRIGSRLRTTAADKTGRNYSFIN